MELICGACHGRLLAEVPGTTVACPHCGTHLQTPPVETPLPTEATILVDTADDAAADAPNPDKDTIRMDFWVPAVDPTPSGVPEFLRSGFPAADLPSVPGEVGSAAAAEQEAAPKPVEASPPVVLADSTEKAEEDDDSPHKTTVVGFVVPPEPVAEAPALAQGSDPERGSFVAGSEIPATAPEHTGHIALGFDLPDAATAPATSETDSTGKAVAVGAGIGIGVTAFVALLSYASAVTLGCLYLAYLLWHNPRTLDLPDLAPPVSKDKRKTTSLIYLPPDKEIPPANVLHLRESRQFGSLLVTPVRVTRGPIEFVYDNPTGGESSEKRDPEGPVVKLHLQFENVSRDQEFVPLDRRLVFTKELDKKAYGVFKTNNFVCSVAERASPANHVLVFDQSPDSSWLLKGQNLDQELNPGQVLNTFIATTPEQIETLQGDLVWRVHFRKGYNPTSLRGVTTLIEVLFRDSDIVEERPGDPGTEAAPPDKTEGSPADGQPGEDTRPVNEKPAVKDV
jgi:hypothetical protein